LCLWVFAVINGVNTFSDQVHGLWVTWHDLGMALPPMECGLIRMLLALTLRTFTDIINRYNSCDVGTFPNQTDEDKLGPAAALHSDTSKDKYNFEWSWLSGQKLRNAQSSFGFR
jgi:hypothetical protein